MADNVSSFLVKQSNRVSIDRVVSCERDSRQRLVCNSIESCGGRLVKLAMLIRFGKIVFPIDHGLDRNARYNSISRYYAGAEGF